MRPAAARPTFRAQRQFPANANQPNPEAPTPGTPTSSSAGNHMPARTPALPGAFSTAPSVCCASLRTGKGLASSGHPAGSWTTRWCGCSGLDRNPQGVRFWGRETYRAAVHAGPPVGLALKRVQESTIGLLKAFASDCGRTWGFDMTLNCVRSLSPTPLPRWGEGLFPEPFWPGCEHRAASRMAPWPSWGRRTASRPWLRPSCERCDASRPSHWPSREGCAASRARAFRVWPATPRRSA